MTTTAIFLPGLYGSTLHCPRSSALRWPAMREILLRRRSLAANAGESLSVGRVVDRVVVVPGLYAMDVYGEALASLRQRADASVEWREFAYDWRAELSTQAQRLDDAVKEERARGRRVALVAHSLGGLLACYYLRFGAQPIDRARETWEGAANVDRIVIAGVPFGGSALALVDLICGRRVAGNGRIMDAATYRSFGATWQLLPAGGTPLIDHQGACLPLDLFDAREWERSGLIPPAADTARHLDNARRLRQLLAAPPATLPPRRLPMLVVQGNSKPTLERVVRCKDAAVPLIDNLKQWQRLAPRAADARRMFGDGDGVVIREASTAPSCWNEVAQLEKLEVRRGHRRLLHDHTVQERIVELLSSADAGG